MSKFAIKGLVVPFHLLLIFLCSQIQTLTLTPPPNNALLANIRHAFERVHVRRLFGWRGQVQILRQAQAVALC